VATELSKRFLETTRGQVLALLRRGPRTVDELARGLGLTDNAIRAHLATLERDGLVRQAGQRRGTGAGKPALLYEVGPDVEVRLSRAYAPVLTALVDELVKELPKDRTEALLRRAGAQLAVTIARPGGTLEGRARQAVALLNELGGSAVLESDGGGFRIRGCGCPLSAAVSRRRETCGAVQSLLSEVVGVSLARCCEYEPGPRCCFVVPPAA
jgi:predicted ArsR family transcriptional regulator